MDQVEVLRAEIAGRLVAAAMMMPNERPITAIGPRAIVCPTVDECVALADQIIKASYAPPGAYGSVSTHDEPDELPQATRSGPPDHLRPDRLRFRATGNG